MRVGNEVKHTPTKFCDICGGTGDVNKYPNDPAKDELGPCHKCGGTGEIEKYPDVQAHTPKPWEVAKHQDYWRVTQTNNNLNEIAICLRKENAEFIVNAVNSHEALFGMLKKVHIEGAGRHYEEIASLIKQAEGKGE